MPGRGSQRQSPRQDARRPRGHFPAPGRRASRTGSPAQAGNCSATSVLTVPVVTASRLGCITTTQHSPADAGSQFYFREHAGVASFDRPSGSMKPRWPPCRTARWPRCTGRGGRPRSSRRARGWSGLWQPSAIAARSAQRAAGTAPARRSTSQQRPAPAARIARARGTRADAATERDCVPTTHASQASQDRRGQRMTRGLQPHPEHVEAFRPCHNVLRSLGRIQFASSSAGQAGELSRSWCRQGFRSPYPPRVTGAFPASRP
jgi:hypothetical protein